MLGALGVIVGRCVSIFLSKFVYYVLHSYHVYCKKRRVGNAALFIQTTSGQSYEWWGHDSNANGRVSWVLALSTASAPNARSVDLH